VDEKVSSKVRKAVRLQEKEKGFNQ